MVGSSGIGDGMAGSCAGSVSGPPLSPVFGVEIIRAESGSAFNGKISKTSDSFLLSGLSFRIYKLYANSCQS